MQLWTEALNSLKLKTTQTVFDQWLAHTHAERHNGTLRILCPDTYTADWLDHRLRPQIETTIHQLQGEELSIEFGVADPEQPPDDAPTRQPTLADLADPEDEDSLSQHLRPKYEINRAGEMVYITYKTQDGSIQENRRIVAPFTCQIVEKLVIYDEDDRRVTYTLQGKKGVKSFTAKISAEDWTDPKRLVGTILKFLPGKPPSTDPAMRKYWGPAIAALTDEQQMREISALPSTGWTPDGKAYVMPVDSVGDSRYICKFDAGLAQEFAGFNLTPRSREEQQTAVNALFDLIRIYNPAVIDTLLAHAFLPPLLRWVGDEARYLYHIHADTGSLKTELGKLIMSLYGPVGTAGITYKWTNTPIGAEARAHALKDTLMLIDDLKPGTISENDQARWVAFIQAAVDALGRKRAAVSGRASVALPPRALLLSTGEAIPEAGEASFTARMLLAELDRQSPGRNQLLDDIKAKAHLFSGLMREYIAWLLKGKGRDAAKKYREIQSTGMATRHARLANNWASNRLGAVMLAQFLQESRLLTVEQVTSYLSNHLTGLNRIVEATANKAHEERYSQRFINGLRDALGAGHAVLSNELVENRVGWQDDVYIYLLSGAKEIVDQWLRRSGQLPINISKKALRKQLFDDGLTHSTQKRIEVGDFNYQTIDPATNSRSLIIAVHKERLL